MKEPSITKKAKNLYKAAKRFVKNKEDKLVIKEKRDKRYNICLSCDKYNPQKDSCSVCGCNMGIKTWIASEFCPLGKWGSSGLVSIIIPSLNEKYLDRTVESLKSTARGNIEFLIIEDKKQEGRRVLINRAAKEAKGEYLYMVDAHCKLTPNWDLLMKKACHDRALVMSLISPLYEDTWDFKKYTYGHVYLDAELTDKWWGDRDRILFEQPNRIQRSMAFTGCGWMIKKDYFWSFDGFNESFGRYGHTGSEWSLNVNLSGGVVLLHRDVICGHLFTQLGKTPTHNVPQQEIQAGKDLLKNTFFLGNGPNQIFTVQYLIKLFQKEMSVPTWHDFNNIKNSIHIDRKITKRTRKTIVYKNVVGHPLIDNKSLRTLFYISPYTDASIQENITYNDAKYVYKNDNNVYSEYLL